MTMAYSKIPIIRPTPKNTLLADGIPGTRIGPEEAVHCADYHYRLHDEILSQITLYRDDGYSETYRLNYEMEPCFYAYKLRVEGGLMRAEIKTKFYKGEAEFHLQNYKNGRLALMVAAVDGEPIMTATVNLPDVDVPEGCVLVKDYSENEGILVELMRLGVVEAPTRSVRTGFVSVALCKLNAEMLARCCR